MKQTPKKRVAADQALSVYLALGPKRSLKRLLEKYQSETGTRPPALSTLKRWSKERGWQDRAREHDIQTAARTSEKAIECEAEERASVFGGIQDTVHDLLALLRETMHGVTIATVEDLKGLSGVIVALSAHSLEIQRGKLPDQDLMAKIMQQMAGATSNGQGAPPSAEELARAIDLAMAEPDET